MRKALLLLPASIAVASPAHATGGMVCETAGAKPIEVVVGFGHAVGAPLISASTRLVDDGVEVPVTAPQWWLDDKEFRLLLADPNAMRREVVIKARRNGDVYDGSLWRNGKRRWVRCREG